MATFAVSMGHNTAKAVSSYHAHRNKAIKQAKPSKQVSVNPVTSAMQSTANERWKQLNFT